MTTMRKNTLIELTEARRVEMAAIISRQPKGSARSTLALVLGRQMRCNPSFREAMSLMGQVSPMPRRLSVAKKHADMEKRFEAMKASRPDLY